MAEAFPRIEREALAFIEELDCLTDTTEVVDAMGHALGRFGFEFFCINGFPRPQQRFEEVMFAIRVPPAWIELYLDKQYAHVDPTMRHCRRTVHPFEWKDAPYDTGLEPRAHEMVRRAEDFGLANGFWVPIFDPAGCEGGVWMGGRYLDLKPHTKPVIHLMALYAFERVRQIHPPAAKERRSLTAREREVLTWAAHGKTAWEIGEILAIAKRTVDEHAQTAFRKLGAVNRTQAVAIALRERLIEP